MAEIDLLMNGGEAADAPTFLFAHGAGATMDAPFMVMVAKGLAARGIRLARFEFEYIATRRPNGSNRLPPNGDILQQEYRKAIAALSCDGPLVIGGKSMGGDALPA
ncbi:Alpha/beta hydrolase family protein [Shimia sp. SK013]|uniref:alpha/beta family hydrolase n=1 Tax=Shimia sp. SK013 TaxID=1389006 RepID=UPI0006CCD867|nr:Alpha/beta hydrolase family protein [Shimia sp. SK013]